jgi:hypothetical protein
MELFTAFGLGVFIVVFIAMVIGTVWMIVKANKLHKQLEQLETTVGIMDQEIHRRLDTELKDRDAVLDSRLDKLENKLTRFK